MATATQDHQQVPMALQDGTWHVATPVQLGMWRYWAGITDGASVGVDGITAACGLLVVPTKMFDDILDVGYISGTTCPACMATLDQ